MNIVSRLGLLASVGVIISVCTTPVVFAETTTIEVKENDTLGSIVIDAYPGYRNRDALMQLILERNPDAFINNDINFLVVGQTLELPGADELGALIQTAPPPPPSPVQQVVSPVDAEAERRLKLIVEERDQLKQQLETLENDNRELKETVSRLEAARTQQNDQLKSLEEQIESLQAQEQTAAATVSPEITKQLAESNEKLKQQSESLRADNKKITSELDAVNQQLKTSQADAEALRTALDTATSDAEILRADLDAVSKQLEVSQSDNTTLRTDLDVAKSDADTLRADLKVINEQLETSQADAAALRTELSDSNQSNRTLKSEIDQIKAAAEKDVTLAPAEPADKPGSNWWPWLLALLLLPVAWLLGQRSRPAPATTHTPEVKAGVKTIEIPAAADPVVPKPLTSDQLDQMAFSGTEAIIVADDPDAAIKLDMARAYLDLRDTEAANDMLQEVIREGGSQQQQEAKEILSFIA